MVKLICAGSYIECSGYNRKSTNRISALLSRIATIHRVHGDINLPLATSNGPGEAPGSAREFRY